MRTLFDRQPAALKTFFATEMWERYGFYVVQSLLALYLALYHHWSDTAVYTLVSEFTALTYLSPVIGGFIADHWLGQKKSILLGTLCLCISYTTLALIQGDTHLKLALAGIAVGTGLLKPNISSLLGHSYSEDAPERESGFTIFYMGITTGIILGTTLPSHLQNLLGWSATFASAAIGALIAMGVFYFGMRRYQIQDYQENLEHTSQTIYKASAAIIGAFLLYYLVLYDTKLSVFMFTAVFLLSVSFIFKTARKESVDQAKQTYVIGMLCFISVIYWAFYFQMFLSLTLFITRLVKPALWGMPFPAPYYVCVESIGMLVFGYFLSRHHIQSNLKQTTIRASTKFLLAIAAITVAYGWIAVVSGLTFTHTLLSPLMLIPAYLLISISELLLSPIGLSIVSMLASRKYVSTLTGIFFVSLSLGDYLSGILAKFTSVDAQMQVEGLIQARYFHGFCMLFLILCFAGIISFYLHRKIIQLMHTHQATPN